ncbi:NlpC/P60 family protein [Actibacterium sp. XHP0104]|uniref:NlpC/P60 family protein n=1 Tax=Actibacterium sp. XHP0104 TaxID=2984335 RepID=UPI0021E8793D|nr:NlpC/P60 family protein [Actibacterium sp. XHP0104]MCV2880987.1 peptidase [Actibacterium sp. XHP0104]
MTAIGDKVAVLARDWLGTPYRHQAAVKGIGSDCLGLVRGLWAEAYACDLPMTPPYSQDWAETGRDEVLRIALEQMLIARPLGSAGSGDVLLFRVKSGALAKHLGVQSAVGAQPRFIHAYWGHGVVESPLSPPWARRIVARFAFPEVE